MTIEFRRNEALGEPRVIIEAAEETGLLSGEELVKIRLLLTLAGRMKEALSSVCGEYQSFSLLLRGLRDFSAECEMLSVIYDEGHLYD